MNRLNIITLGVTDIKRSLIFYKAMGFKTKSVAEQSPDIVFFQNDGTKLALYPLEALAMDINMVHPPKKGKDFSGITIAINVTSKEEVDQTLAKAKANGAKIIKEAEQVFWGGYSGYFEDPDGYVFEVAYAESFVFDKNNMLIVE